MTKKQLYLILQAAVCIALAVWLSLSAAGILREGSARKAEHPTESIYTPESVAEKLMPMAPLLIAGAGLLIAGLVLGVKDERAEKPVKRADFRGNPPVSRGVQARLRAIIIAAAVAFIIAGILNGSVLDVLYKAITICTECIGLG